MAKTSTVDACAACGKKEETSVCGRCEKVSYCGSACQKTHWKSHKATCQLSLENIACCDVCKVSQREGVELVCKICGGLYCGVCVKNAIKSPFCQLCSKPSNEAYPTSKTSIKAFLDLVEKDTCNKRRGRWLTVLGQYYRDGIDGVLAQD